MSLQKLQQQFLSFLKQQAGKDSPKTPFVYTSEPYSHPIEDYINGADSHSAEYCHRILQILQFAHSYLRMPETEAKSLGIYTLCCLTKAVRYASPKGQEELLYLLGKAYLVPCMAYKETLNDPVLKTMFPDTMESYIHFLRAQGQDSYPYACALAEKFIPRYNKDRNALARNYYWLAWMYLSHGERAKAMATARKIPKVPGMEQGSTRITEWAKQSKKSKK